MFIIKKHSMYISMISTLFLITNVDFSAENDLGGRHFNYLVFDNPPFDTVTRGPNGTFTFYGSDYYLTDWIASKFNFTYSFVLINQTIAEKYGTHEALFYQLINDKDVDGIACSFFLTMDRVERMDYSFFTWSEGFSLVVPRPGEESRLFAFIGPFQPNVWMLVFISLIVIIGTMTFFTWCYNRRFSIISMDDVTVDSESKTQHNRNVLRQRSNFFFLGSHITYVINTITNQGGKEAFSRNSFRVLAGIWVLCATVLVNSYTGIVISSLTKPKMKPSIESFEDLAASSEIGIVLRYDTSIGEQILKATSGVYKVLGDQARLHPDQIVGDPFKLAAKLQTGHYAYPFLRTFGIAFVGSQYKKDKKCRFKTSKMLPISTGFYSLLFKKGSSYTKTISQGLMDLWESGLLAFWVRNLPTIPKANECFADEKNQVSRLVPIRLSDLTSAFLILGIGIGLASLSFLLELIYYNMAKKYLFSAPLVELKQ